MTGMTENNDWDDDDEWDDFDNRREGVFRWEGRVDIGAEIEIRGDQHRVKDMGGQGGFFAVAGP